MANKRIDELISKAIIDANDLVFVGDPLTGWLYKATVADLQAGVTGGIGGSGTANFIPKFATANTIGNSTIFDNGTSVAIGTTTPNASFKFVVNGNVSFGEYGLNTGFVSFDTTPTNTPTSAGTLSWNDTDGTLDLTLKGGNVTNQIGQEINKRVVNKSGATLNEADFRAVRIRLVSEGGAQGQRLAVVLAQADNDTNSATTIGLVTETIANNAEGFITLIGEVKEIDTTGAKSYGGTETWSDGDILYLSPTHAGYLTNVKPQAPQHTIVIGFVSYAHAIHGKIDVKVDNGYELDELHNVKINTPLHNQALIFNSSDNTWRNRTIIKTDGYVPYFDQSSLFLDSPLYTNGTKVAIGTNSFIGTNLLSVQGGIYSEEHTINGNLLIHSNTLSGNAFISRWSGTTWDVEQTFYSDHILFSKDIESTKFTKTGGTSAQFLMADGSTATTSSLSLLTGPGTQNYIAKFYDASGLAMYNSQLYDNGTNVGIGTTTPFKKFTVQGGAISVYSSSTNFGFMDTSNNSFSFTSANGFYFVANNIGTVASTYVDTTGKWGFGVGTPSYKVDVNGDVNTNGIYRISGLPLSTTNIAEGTNLYFTSNRVLGQVLTGLNTSLTGVVTSADSLIVGISKLQNQVSSIVSGVSSVFGRTGAVTAASGDYNTSQVTESTNLYYTQARFDSAFGAKSTTNLTEGTNLYYTDARARLAHSFAAGSGAYNSTTGVITIPTNTNQLTNGASFITLTSLSAGSGISYNNTTGVIASTITQYTDAMARASISLTTSGTSGAATYNSTTGVLNIPQYQSVLTNPITGTGTTNYLPKFTGSTTLGNSLIYDNGTNVGISTATPASKFQINLTTNENVAFGSLSAIPTGRTLILQTSSAGGQIETYSSITGGYVNTLINPSGGNVGIGTSSPGAKLDVSGDIYSNTRILADTFGGYSGGDVTLTTNTSGTANLIFKTASTERMRLTSTGNLGLGVTPSAWSGFTAFDIGTTGNLASYGSGSDVQLNANAYYNGLNWIYKTTNSSGRFRINGNQFEWINAPSGTAGTAISFTQAMTLDASGNLGVGMTSPTIASGYRSLILNGTSGTIIRTQVNGIGAFDIQADSGYTYLWEYRNAVVSFGANGGEKMRLNPNGTFSIGNTNNTYKLDVSGTGYFLSYLTINSYLSVDAATTNPSIIMLNTGGNRWELYPTSSAFTLYNRTGNITPLSIANTGAATFSNNLTVQGSGGFSWGFPSTAVAKIGAPGTGGSLLVMTPSLNSSYESGFAVDGTYASGKTEIILNAFGVYSGGPYSADFVFKTSTNTTLSEKMRITNAGNVGIGTSSPNLTATNRTTVDINGVSNSLLSLSAGGVNKGYLYSDGGSIIYANSSNTFVIQTQGINGLTIGPTQAATFASSVTSYSTISGVGLYAGSGTNQSYLYGGNLIYYNAASSAKYIQLQDDASTINAIGFSKSGSTATTWFPSGSVGISTSSPSAQLHVASGNVVFGGNPTTQYKFNVQGVSGKYLSFWTPTISSANNNGIMSHDGNGLSGLTPFGHYGSFHVFNGEVTGGGMVQVAGDVNISGTFKVNGTPIGTGGGGVSGSGTSQYVPIWSSATSLTNSVMYVTGSTFVINSELITNVASMVHGSGSIAGRYKIARPSDGATTAAYFGFHSTSNTDFGIANNSGGGEIRMYANSLLSFTVKYATINLPNVPSGTAGLSSGDVYKDALGYLKIV